MCGALFRMYPIELGKILIASQDISKISLARVRRSIAIIPQDPVLFAGTLRFNVDPEEIYRDNEIWEAFELTGLKETVFFLNLFFLIYFFRLVLLVQN